MVAWGLSLCTHGPICTITFLWLHGGLRRERRAWTGDYSYSPPGPERTRRDPAPCVAGGHRSPSPARRPSRRRPPLAGGERGGDQSPPTQSSTPATDTNEARASIPASERGSAYAPGVRRRGGTHGVWNKNPRGHGGALKPRTRRVRYEGISGPSPRRVKHPTDLRYGGCFTRLNHARV